MTETRTKLTKKAAAALQAGEGRAILAVAPHYWGRGPTGADALRVLRGSGARRGADVVLFDVPEGTQVNDLGGIVNFPPDGRTWDEATPEEHAEWRRVEELGWSKV